MRLPEEIKDFSKFTHRLKRVNDLKYIRAEAEKISELKADPRWEIYGRRIETKKEVHSKILEAQKNRLENAFLNPQDYGETKVKQAYNQGCLDALNYAIEIAQVLIEQGERALEELKNIKEVS